MAVFDVILFLVVLLFAALGVRRGLVLTVCGLLSILVALGGAKVAADSLSPVVAEAITPRITTTVEDRLEKNVNQSMKDAGETAKDSLSGILSIFGNSETYEKASEQLQKAIQSGPETQLGECRQIGGKGSGTASGLVGGVWHRLLPDLAGVGVGEQAAEFGGEAAGAQPGQPHYGRRHRTAQGRAGGGTGLLGHPPLGAGDGGRDPGERVFAVFFKFFLGGRIVPSRKTRFIHICMI